MARLLPYVPMKAPPSLPLPAATFFLVFFGVVSVFSIVTFLCTSHRRSKIEKKTVQLGERKPEMTKLGSSISCKALLMARMISWRKVNGEEGDAKLEHLSGDADEEAVWKRTIIMGERCRPLNFSGRILYDSEGNPLPEMPPSSNGHGGQK